MKADRNNHYQLVYNYNSCMNPENVKKKEFFVYFPSQQILPNLTFA